MIKTLQTLLVYPFIKYIYSPILQISYVRQFKELNPYINYVICSNHVSATDPFIATIGLGYKNLFKISPVRYMAHNKFIDAPIVGPVIRAFGSFPAKPHARHAYGLDAALSFLDKEQPVYIFPEGKVVKREGEPITYRRGVSVLANRADINIIPVRFVKLKGSRYTGVRVIVGKPFDGRNMSPREIMDKVYELK